MIPPVVAVVGYSNSGKTTVATTLIHALTKLGLRIAAVKHCHDGHQLEIARKDSAALFAAGASRTIVVSPGQVTSVQRTIGDTTLEEIVGSLESGYDLVIAEGFKASSVPKVLVCGEEAVQPPPSNVIAVVGDQPEEGDTPCYSFTELDGLVQQILDQLLCGAGYTVESTGRLPRRSK